jgi:UDP-N-acetyl-D-mannosaminuronate dehydrogenase
VVALVKRALGGSVQGRKVAALGLSYKPDVDDLRESPAVEVACRLQAEGAEVLCYEPNKPDAQVRGLALAPNLATAIAEAEVLLLLVGHAPLRALSPVEIGQLSPARVAVDCVHGWDRPDWEALGFRFFRIGVNC